MDWDSWCARKACEGQSGLLVQRPPPRRRRGGSDRACLDHHTMLRAWNRKGGCESKVLTGTAHHAPGASWCRPRLRRVGLCLSRHRFRINSSSSPSSFVRESALVPAVCLVSAGAHVAILGRSQRQSSIFFLWLVSRRGRKERGEIWVR